MSWDTTVYSNELYEKVQEYPDVLFITSAGKERHDLRKQPVYPCSFDLNNVVCVAAANNQGNLYEFSGYGTKDIVIAPGEGIVGMLPEGDYLFSNGTSFATAYVSGIAGLIKSIYFDITTEELSNILKTSNNQDFLINSVDTGLIDAKIALQKAELALKNY